MKFTELSLNENIQKGIADAGFTDCMPVQDATFEHSLKRKDVCVQSQTGSGKTVAFLITIYQILMEDEAAKEGKALIVVPTRELAVQIETEALLLNKYLPFKVGAFYGGVGYDKQERMLAKGVDIVIGTPGRLIDFGQSGRLKFNEFTILVIDEADRLFDMGFYPDITRILRKMKPPKERITMLFSATLGDKVTYLARDHMNTPVEIEITPENMTVDNVVQRLYHVSKDEKFRLLLGILNKENPHNALIFANTKRTVEQVAARLDVNGYKCEFIIGDLPQSKRLKIIDGMKHGEIRFLVATNVAARGLHIDDLDLVVNYDLPFDSEDYVHRIGRTARAGKSGLAISLACEEFVYELEDIEAFTRMKIPVEWPDESMFPEDKSAGMRIYTGRNRDSRERRDGDKRRGDRKGPRDSRDRNPRRRDEGQKVAASPLPEKRREKQPEKIAAPMPAETEAGKKKRRRRRKKKSDVSGAVTQAPAAAAQTRRHEQKKKAPMDRGRHDREKPRPPVIIRDDEPPKKSFWKKVGDVIMGRYEKKYRP